MNEDGPQSAQSIEQIVKRYSVRPGYQLLGYREVGLPFYYLRLRAVVMAHKTIPPIAEYVLKSLNLGLQEEDDFGGFLGLEPSIVRRTLVDLRQSDDIDLIAPIGSRLQQWTLTAKGRSTLRSAEQVIPEEISLSVYYDGLLRRVVTREQASLATGRELHESDAIQIAPIPARKPELDEITISEVNAAIREMARRGSSRRDLLVIKAVLSGSLYYERAVMLLFQSVSGPEIQVAFAIDGSLSPSHEQAFVASGGLRKLGISEEIERLSANEVADRLLPKDVLQQIGDLASAEELKQQAQKAHAEIDDGTRRLLTARTEAEQQTVRDQLATAHRLAKAAERQLDKLPVSLVETYEHRAILESAILNSRERLLINSPWINARAVTHDFLKALERRLLDGLKVYIAYGLDPEDRPSSPSDRNALNALQGLHRTYPSNFRLTRLGDTHAKVLISDADHMVVTSFNWLSFRGDPNRTFRDERGLLVRIPEVIDAQFERIVKRMDDAEAGSAST